MTARALLPLVPLALALGLAPLAAATPASEEHPDCEAGQPWIGYRSTMPLMQAYAGLGAPGGLHPCEGEHWDGQDPLRSGWDSCSGSASLDPSALRAGLCMQADPNAGPSDDPLNPVGVRLSTDGTDAAYAAANVAFVGRVAVYADDDTVAVYARDNTPGNMLVTILGPWRITQDYRPESDCDQATYQQGAMTGTPLCWRDNTAITLEHDLLS